MSPRTPTARSAAPLLLGLAFAASACLPEATGVTVVPRPLPPLFGAAQMKVVKTLQPRSRKFKIAVLTFVDQTGKAEEAEGLIANMLSAEIKETGRFELYDRQQLAEAVAAVPGATDAAKKAAVQYDRVSGKVDGILIGYITSMRFDAVPPPAPPRLRRRRPGEQRRTLPRFLPRPRRPSPRSPTWPPPKASSRWSSGS